MLVSGKRKNEILVAVKAVSTQWKAAFNSGDVANCALLYENTAHVVTRPFGTYIGTTEIQAFWQKLIDDGF